MGRRHRILLLAAPIAMLWPQPLPAADRPNANRPASIRVGNLANKGELARFERRVREGCGQDARIRLQRQASDKPQGRVIGQHPPRGTRIGCDAAAAILYVSAGQSDAILYVPALVEPAQRRAFAHLLHQVCRAPVAIAEVRRPYPVPPGRFVDQTPAQGVRYRCGTPVEVRISAGPPGQARAVPKARAEPARRAPAAATPAERPAAPLADPPPPQREAPPTQPPPTSARQPAPPIAVEPIQIETLHPDTIPARPRQAPRPGPLYSSLAILLLAALLVVLMLRRFAPAPRPAAAPSADRSARPAAPVAPLLTLGRGWPTAEARLLPPARVPPGPPADTLPPVPLLRDLLRPLDPALDWIAGTPLAALGDNPPSSAPDAETLASLRPDIAEALRFALLFELPPLLAHAWATADRLPVLDQAPSRGWCPLAPHSVELLVTPMLELRAAGLAIARPRLQLRVVLTFPAARLFLRGTALDAFEAGAVHASASLSWLGQTRPLAVLRPHAAWPGSVAVAPPLQIHDIGGTRLQGVG